MIKHLRQIARDIKELLLAFVAIITKQIFVRRKGLQRLSMGNYALYQRICTHVIGKYDMRVIDVGANDGWFSNIIYAFVPKASILAFEPLVSQKENINKLMRKGRDFVFKPLVVGDARGSMTLHESSTDGLSSLREQIVGAYDHDFNTTITHSYLVDVTTLDHELDHEKKDIFLKIDVQGYEMEVLRGAENLFKKEQIGFVLVELCTQKNMLANLSI